MWILNIRFILIFFKVCFSKVGGNWYLGIVFLLSLLYSRLYQMRMYSNLKNVCSLVSSWDTYLESLSLKSPICSHVYLLISTVTAELCITFFKFWSLCVSNSYKVSVDFEQNNSVRRGTLLNSIFSFI